MKKLCDIELLRALCLEFGPTGSEESVAELIKNQLPDELFFCDKMGNITLTVKGEGKGSVMVSAHMDEVGMIINEITEDGYARFSCLGGIDPRVLCGRNVTVCGKEGLIPGVIISKAIHLQSAEERKTATTADKMYIDIGARSRECAEKYISVGDSATFDSEFIRFGSGDNMLKGKAIDDRLGCSAMIEIVRRLREENRVLPYDVHFCFTVREEVGYSGAQTTAHRLAPDVAIVLESTAIADIADVKESSKVARVCGGGAISLADRSTIYDRVLVDLAMAISKEKNIPAQIKQLVSGGNDSGHIHKTGKGVRPLAISAPTRYLHTAACVSSVTDYYAIRDLVYELLCSGKLI